MSSSPEFQPFPKIPRLNREMVVTEKLDGSNAAVLVTEEGEVLAQSRKRFITPGKSTDNFGFAAWVAEHEDELREGLGEGRHFGEWYGRGIQRGYGLEERRFALFNVQRWLDPSAQIGSEEPPACCEVVPILHVGAFDLAETANALSDLEAFGSLAVPGFMDPEGIVVLHLASRQPYKVTFEHDYAGKEAADVAS